MRASVDTVFPAVAVSENEEDVTFLLDHVQIGAGPSTLHTTGRDWLYPEETWVRFKHALQGVDGSGQEIVDAELFMAGGMSITSEVEVGVEPSTLRVDETDIAGWTAQILSWRIRIADRIDYEAGDTQFLPVGTASIELPDDRFLELQANGCPGHPTPVDFDVITDAWHAMGLGRLQYQTLFIAAAPYNNSDGDPYSSETPTFDFFDPVARAGINLIKKHS